MALRILLFTAPAAAVVGLVLLLNSLNAGVGVAAAALGFVAVSSGAVFGYRADALPRLSRAKRSHHRLVSAHHGD